jgi:hypothetical protein
MSAQPNDEYGFNEADLKANPGAGVETLTADSAPQAIAIEPTLRDEELRADVREPLVQPVAPEPATATVSVKAQHPGLTKSEKLKWGAIIGAGGAILFGALVYLAWGIIHPHTAQQKPKAFDFEVQSSNRKSVTSEPQLGGNEKADPVRQKRLVDDASKNPTNVSPDSQVVAPVRMNQEDEDEFYDNLANAAGQQPVDKSVAPVAPEVKQHEQQLATTPDQGSGAQLNAMSQELKNNTAQMARLLDALHQVNSDVAALKTQVESDTKQSAKYGAQISAISESLSAITVKNEERFKAVTDVAVAAALAAVKKQGAPSTAGSGKMVLVGGPKIPTKPTERQPAKESQSRSAFAASAAPQVINARPAVVASAPVSTQAQQVVNKTPECGAKTISQNWNVKGVSPSAAYIRRTDGEGIMVRAEMEVPGFGIVKSFDPNNRTVCTTSGLIVR